MNDQPNCPHGQELCGFKEGDVVLIFDNSGHFDTFTITNVQDSAGHLQHRGQDLSYGYDTGASVLQAESHTYYLDTTTQKLMHYDGGTDAPQPVVDNVVGLRFDYYGDPAPPVQPKPALGNSNCLYDAAGNSRQWHDDADDRWRIPGPAADLDVHRWSVVRWRIEPLRCRSLSRPESEGYGARADAQCDVPWAEIPRCSRIRARRRAVRSSFRIS